MLQLYELGIYRALPEFHVWSIELGDLAVARQHPVAPRALGAAARAAWLRGELDRALDFGHLALTLTDDEAQLEGAIDALGIVALLQGEFAKCEELELRAAAVGTRDRSGAYLPTAALGMIYAGNEARARELLARAREVCAASGSRSDYAFLRYCEGELLARGDLDAAIAAYEEAIDVARSVDASFVEGVATVGLVSVWGRSGRLVEALGGYRWLIDYWRRAGHWTQMWTTMRNLAGTLAAAGQSPCAALLLAAAEHAEGTASLDPDTAAQQSRLRAELEARLGAEEMARQQARARSLHRMTVVEEALAAVDAALREA